MQADTWYRLVVVNDTTSALATVYEGAGLDEVLDWKTINHDVNAAERVIIFENNADARSTGSDETSGAYIDNVEVVPEPATMAFLGIGAAGLLIRRRR
ncbi:MAG: PEP-CTERM sorting domain-containing protein [Planctomycetota bacterium]|nr:PEP-CTERM sorting domain-containing protein [Planctomycetota bacterium]